MGQKLEYLNLRDTILRSTLLLTSWDHTLSDILKKIFWIG